MKAGHAGLNWCFQQGWYCTSPCVCECKIEREVLQQSMRVGVCVPKVTGVMEKHTVCFSDTVRSLLSSYMMHVMLMSVHGFLFLGLLLSALEANAVVCVLSLLMVRLHIQGLYYYRVPMVLEHFRASRCMAF